MRWVGRSLEKTLQQAIRSFHAIVLTGPRRAGKTALLRHLVPKASYRLLESPDVVARAKADPQGFLDSLPLPVVLDEIQSVPELLPAIRARIDARPSRKGDWLITGSHDFALMQGVTESMAGRAAVLTLLPLSAHELGQLKPLRGGYPEVWARPSAASLWFESYLQTYLKRDVRTLRAVHDLSVFRRFIAFVASRHGQVVNRSDIAAPLGLSVPTVNAWLGVLETTAQIALVPPYFENFGKRLIKSPKLYWLDSGMVCHLLGIETEAQLKRSPFLGAVTEGVVAAELLKAQVNRGRRRELYYFRDERGLEIDFLVPLGEGRLAAVEVKASKTVTPRDAESMLKLPSPPVSKRTIVYGGTQTLTVAKCVTAKPLSVLVEDGGVF